MGCCNSVSESDEAVLKPGGMTRSNAETDSSNAKNSETFEITLHVKPGEKYLFESVLDLLAAKLNASVVQVETEDVSGLTSGVVIHPAVSCKYGVVSGERVIPRFLAQMGDLYPATVEDVYLCESLVEQVCDMWRAISSDPQGQMVGMQAEMLHPIAARLRETYFVGHKPSLADIFVYFFIDDCFLSKDRADLVPERLQVFHSAFQSSPLYQPFANF